MSQPQPPYQQPYQPPPPRPVKYRPRAWWFVLGGGLIVAAVGIGIALFVWALSGFLDSDGQVLADGEPHALSVGTDRERMLWTADDDQRCQVVDRETGDPIPLRPVSGSFTRSDSQGELEGRYRFDPGSGHITVACTPDEPGFTERVLVGPAPRIGSFVGGIVAAIVVPLVLGLAGMAVLIVTGVLYATRPRRPAA